MAGCITSHRVKFSFQMQTYQLFCGRDIPTGGYVTRGAFKAFTQEHVDPLFDGYTVSDVQGVWKGVPEETKCISICTDREQDVMAIAKAYKELFNQDSVAIQLLAPMSFV